MWAEGSAALVRCPGSIGQMCHAGLSAFCCLFACYRILCADPHRCGQRPDHCWPHQRPEPHHPQVSVVQPHQLHVLVCKAAWHVTYRSVIATLWAVRANARGLGHRSTLSSVPLPNGCMPVVTAILGANGKVVCCWRLRHAVAAEVYAVARLLTVLSVLPPISNGTLQVEQSGSNPARIVAPASNATVVGRESTAS